MSRYIDADALLKCTGQAYDENGVGFYCVGTGDILRMPIADVVEVVRCKNCKWYGVNEVKKDGTIDMRYKPSFCYLYNKSHEEFYFCADGERREDEPAN